MDWDTELVEDGALGRAGGHVEEICLLSRVLARPAAALETLSKELGHL